MNISLGKDSIAGNGRTDSLSIRSCTFADKFVEIGHHELQPVWKMNFPHFIL
jgi:hypothetical protein